MRPGRLSNYNPAMNSYRAIALVVFLLAALSLPAVVGAQGPGEVTVNDVASELYCPLCSGLTVDVCELEVCDEMRLIIDGEDPEQIKTYFIEQYGQAVVGMPSTEGFHLTAWVMPVLALLAAIAVFVFWLRSKPTVPSRDERVASGARTTSDYEAQLERELRRIE